MTYGRSTWQRLVIERTGRQRGPERLLTYVAVAAAVSLAAMSGGLACDRSQPPDSGPADQAVEEPTVGSGVGEGGPPSGTAPSGVQGVPEPTSGTYLGAFVNTLGIQRGGIKVVLDNLPAFTQQTGRNPAIVAAYQPWKDTWVSNEDLSVIADSYGAIPMVSWQCGDTNERIASGADDALITRFAEQLVRYGRPIFLRWYWEMNLPISQNCHDPGSAPDVAAHYVDAFRHIGDLFDQAGASNVAFVWTPSVSEFAAPMEMFYPGDEYVDWIGADGYDRELGSGGFADVFGDWYRVFAGRGKPMIVAETGATTDQTEFLQGVGEVLPRDFPRVKGFVYFDAVGQVDWRLSSYGGAGLSAFAALGRNPDFTAMPGR